MPNTQMRQNNSVKSDDRRIVETLIWEDEEQKDFDAALEQWVDGKVTYRELRQTVPRRYRNLIRGILDTYVNKWLHSSHKAA